VLQYGNIKYILLCQYFQLENQLATMESNHAAALRKKDEQIVDAQSSTKGT